VGEHVAQRGSLNNADRLRFDFSHDKPVTEEQIFLVEQLVNKQIRENTSVITEIMQLESAKQQGARALFGEKYGDDVRVVKMSPEDEGHFSIELCGGTHVNSTGDIGFLKIIGESASSSGVRRLEAVTGKKVVDFIENIQVVNNRVATLLNVNSENLVERVNSLLEEKKRLEQKNNELNKALISGEGEQERQNLEKIGENIIFSGKIVKDIPGKDLRTFIDNIKKQNKNVIAVLLSKVGTKVQIAVGVSDTLVERVSAIDLVKILSSKTGGKGGGGRPDFAQGGGTLPDQADKALSHLKSYLNNSLSDD
jgi:alanyl-tRNA synthetase